MTRFTILSGLSLLVCIEIAACGSSTSVPGPGDVGTGGSAEGGADSGNAGATSRAGAAADLVGAFEAAGFSVGAGKFQLLDLSDCCSEGRSCSGNNPSSPYLAYSLPRAPGQTTPNEREDADGLTSAYRLGPSEAVVWVGETPPAVAYFGFTDYLMTRDDGSGNHGSIFASLGETLNVGVIGVEGPSDATKFGRRAMVIHTPDATTGARVKQAALRSGFPEPAINIAPIDAEITRLGLDASSDTLGVLFRAALFEDAEQGNGWLASPPVELYRLTPTTEPLDAEPFGRAVARTKDDTNDENPTYAEAAAELERAIIDAYATTHDAVVEPMTEGTPDPYACIAGERTCAGDNRDTIYPSTGPFLWPVRAKDFLIVHGVDHAQTGKATYANASLYAVQHLAGVAAVSSKVWHGSAARYLPNHPLVDKLYAYKLSRSCEGEDFCLEVPDAPCPNGIAPGSLAVIAFRAYLEPSSSTAPNPSLLVPDGVLRFKLK